MINVIGIGQNRENMTLGALKAIEESDVIIGYKKYINQIEDLIEERRPNSFINQFRRSRRIWNGKCFIPDNF